MNEEKYYVIKESGTYSNVLEAYGLAELLARINSSRSKLIIENKGECYEITVINPDKKGLTYFDLFPYIKTKPKKFKDSKKEEEKSKLKENKRKNNKAESLIESEIMNYVDYEEEKLKKKRFDEFKKAVWSQKKEAKKQNPKEYKRIISNLDKKVSDYEEKPRDDWDVITGINSLKAVDTYKKIYLNLYSNKEKFPELIDMMLTLYGSIERNIETVKNRIKKMERVKEINSVKEADSLQLFNPSMVKGAHAPKPNSITPKARSGFWLEECMKIIGSFNGMIVKAIKVSNRDWDCKVYVIDANCIDWNKRKVIFSSLKSALKGITSTKLDISSILITTKRLIENHSEYVEKKNTFLKKYRPKNEIKGLHTAYFKKMGSASSPSNISYLELPEFIEINSLESADAWISIIDEHLSVMNGIRVSADKSDESGEILPILQDYRQFLTTGEIDCFFKFAAAYSAFLMQQIGKGDYYTRAFSTKLMEVFLMEMDKKLGDILENEGFKSIARAIRKSTISEQYAKSRGEQLYEIKYGLAQDIIRKSDYKEDFVEFISEFIVSYNQETARFAEKKKDKGKLRATIKQQDMTDLINLVDEYGSSIVGRMLCAYGFTLDRRSREAQGDEIDTDAEDESENEE